MSCATIAASRSTGRSRTARACGKRSRSPGVRAPWMMPRLRAVSSAADNATASGSLNSTSTLAVCLYCTLTASSTRPRPMRRCTLARMRPSASASVCGTRSCRSRWRWLTARIVTVMVAASDSLVADAKPVMLLIMFIRGGPSPHFSPPANRSRAPHRSAVRAPHHAPRRSLARSPTASVRAIASYTGPHRRRPGSADARAVRPRRCARARARQSRPRA